MTKKLGWTALGGVFLIVILVLRHRQSLSVVSLEETLGLGAFILIFPFILYVNIFTIWHWKRRYRGERSELWGAVLLIETSGWFKIVYWFRHIIPDWRSSGRYAADRIG
ncbi:MAG: hypothetical protein ACHQT6_10795 [Candidatus Acidiferrales bacterium]